MAERLGVKEGVVREISPDIRKLALYIGVPVAALCVAGGVYYIYSRSTGDQVEEQKSLDLDIKIGIESVHAEDADTDGQVHRTAKAAKLKGNKYFKAGRYENAIQCYTEAIILGKDDSKDDVAVYYQNRAAAQEQLQKWNSVVDDCTEALKLKPKYNKALARRARAYENLGMKREGLEDVTAVCILEGFQNQHCILQADRILKDLGKELAIAHMKERRPVLPSATFVQSYLDSFSTDVFHDNFTDGDKQSSPFYEAIEKMRKKEFEPIVGICSQEINQDGKFKDKAHLLRGTMYTLMSDVPGAMSDFAILISLENTDESRKLKSNALIKRGSLKMQQSLDQACLDDFQEAVRIDPWNADVYHHRGQIYFLTERLQEAKADFEKAIELSRTFVAPRLQLGYCQCKLAMQLQSPSLMQAADNILEETTKLFPESSDAFSLYGQLLQDQLKFAEAEKKFDKALELNPTNPTTYVYKALLVLQWKQDLEKANQLIRKGLAVDDKCDFAYETLATLEVQRGNLDEAVRLFNKAIDLVRTEGEMSHTFSLLEAAKAQGNVTRKYGISVPASPFM